MITNGRQRRDKYHGTKNVYSEEKAVEQPVNPKRNKPGRKTKEEAE